MGTILASAIISKAVAVLQDASNVHWSQAELLGWLNDGQRAICEVLPELSVTLGNIPLVAGAKQALPSGANMLLRITRNMGTSGTTVGRAVRKVNQEVLDAVAPDWYTDTAVTSIRHYTYDVRSPKAFYVYPPSVAGNNLEGLYAVSPTDIASTSAAITLDDIYEPILLDYALYRAFSKDLETPGGGERSAAHYGAFTSALSAKKTVDLTVQPSKVVAG